MPPRSSRRTTRFRKRPVSAYRTVDASPTSSIRYVNYVSLKSAEAINIKYADLIKTNALIRISSVSLEAVSATDAFLIVRVKDANDSYVVESRPILIGATTQRLKILVPKSTDFAIPSSDMDCVEFNVSAPCSIAYTINAAIRQTPGVLN